MPPAHRSAAWTNALYFGDNLAVLRQHIRDESVDLCYIDPPFNSKKNYNQIYTNATKEDPAQAQAFIDTWSWDRLARRGLLEMLENATGRFTPACIELIKGFRNVLQEGSLLAYLVSMALRMTEIRRVLKPTGSLYLHCDPTASHYLKLLLDTIFEPTNFRNELIWLYRGGGRPKKDFGRKHDVIFRYSKGPAYAFYPDAVRIPYQAEGVGRTDTAMWGKHKGTDKIYTPHPLGKVPEDWWPINALNANDPERLGYPTQKPEALLERILNASSQEGDLILDAYCGCGTTVAVAQRLNRQWIGIDITYQSISLILKRLEDTFGAEALTPIRLDGIPKDMASATALAQKKDDRVRKEFEKWAVLTYSNNRAIIHDKKGADHGIDGTAYFMVSHTANEKVIFQVKSGTVGVKDIRDFRGTMAQARAPVGVFLTLQAPTAPMRTAARAAGTYHHQLMGKDYEVIRIVTIQDLIEQGARLDMPLLREVVPAAARQFPATQLALSPSGV